MKQGFAQLALIAIILLLITSGLAVFFIAKNKTPQNPTPLPAEVLTKEETPNPTANWEMYDGENFSFKYPSDILLNARDLDCDKSQLLPLQMYDKTEKVAWSNTYNKNPQQTCNTAPISLRISPGDFPEPKSDGYWNVSSGTEIIDNQTLKKYTQTQTHLHDSEGITSPFEKTVVIPLTIGGKKNFIMYALTKNSTTLTETVFDQILSTFKFTDKQSITNLNWKTYKNSKAGYSFKYPEDHTVYEGIADKSPTFIAATPTSEKVKIAELEEQVFCCEPLTLSFSIETSKLSVEKWLEEQLKEWEEEMPKIQKVIFAGKPATQAFGRGGYGPPYKIIVIQLQDSILVISQNSQSSLMDQILSTFRFVE